jgi:hypothetical protein
MEQWQRDLMIGAGIVLPPIVIVGVLAAMEQQPKNVLVLTVSGPGIVNIPTGTHSYSNPTQVTITAYPNSGYQANWALNGVDVEQGVNTYSIYVNGLVTLGVYFTPTTPTTGTIAGIRAVGTVGTLQNFDYYFDDAFGPIIVSECDESWNKNQACQPSLMQFKVYDQGMNGIPNQQVNIYPDINPDASAFKTYAMFDPYVTGPWAPTFCDINSPLTITTDSQGLASFLIRNFYGAEGEFLTPSQVSQAPTGFGRQLSISTNVFATVSTLLINSNVWPIWKGQLAGAGSYWWAGGGGGPTSYNRLIHAEVANTAYYVEAPVSVVFQSKWG